MNNVQYVLKSIKLMKIHNLKKKKILLMIKYMIV